MMMVIHHVQRDGYVTVARKKPQRTASSLKNFEK